MKTEKVAPPTEQAATNSDDVLRRLLAMPPQPKKPKQGKDKPAK